MAKVNPIQLQKFLKGVDYPAKKADLVSQAQSHGADKNVLDTLNQLSENDFETPAEVSKAIGAINE